MTTVDLRLGDCLEVMRGLADASVDACVTDPPYGLSFMGKGWDHAVPGPEVWREVFRVLKPGAHLLAFFGTRTYHRGVVAIEDAGFEVRDQIGWAFGSGFPKSHNGPWGGTALKPAWEPVVVARKPLDGTVENNWRLYGTGALNIDGCRIEAGDKTPAPVGTFVGSEIGPTGLRGERDGSADNLGRWPANLIHDGSDEVVALFPQSDGQNGEVGPQHGERPSINTYGDWGPRPTATPRGDTGSAARFFYCAKADRRDRDEGLALTRRRTAGEVTGGRAEGSAGLNNPRAGAGRTGGGHNFHPTVKPTDLMRYLCRLVTPPGGVVLDPFMGSGSTGKAAVLEQFNFIGIERDAEYLEIARARIAFVQAEPIDAGTPRDLENAPSGAQLSLLGAT